ncbi:hypothetical protein [Falsiroseomonas oryzae]|uniref:hypothetical protein n=1 Tax=Falsiroseomonas oryzae TaxID=2766473 RepID=UPI0022EA9F91|nr:hypothetical protein [Roseomonas sp. MO-31]
MIRLLLLLPLLALPAAPQEIPACNQDRVGAVACMSGKLCACGYARGGIVSGRPDGYRWDCGVLRPSCGEALQPGLQPALPEGAPWPMPQLYLNLTPPTRPAEHPPVSPGTLPFSPWTR